MNAQADLQFSCSKSCRQLLLQYQANFLHIADVFDITSAIFIANYRKTQQLWRGEYLFINRNESNNSSPVTNNGSK